LAPDPLPIRYLCAADVLAAMPDVDERLKLAEHTMTALVADAELPPKIGVHPRPDGSFAHAMPAHLRGADPGGGDDLLGMKWVAGFGRNNQRGLPAINAVVVINDAATGLPTAILDGNTQYERLYQPFLGRSRFRERAGRAAVRGRCRGVVRRESVPGGELGPRDR
jgi:hypothetical protein